MKNIPILHLICGLPGSGKTTLAREIEISTGAIRFCPDEWIKEIWQERAEGEGNNFRDAIENLQWKIARGILQNKVDAIIEWGTWGRNEREKLRDEAHDLGARVKFYYLKVPIEILSERMIRRSAHLSDHELHIPETDVPRLLEEWWKAFHEPTIEELESYDFLGDVALDFKRDSKPSDNS